MYMIERNFCSLIIVLFIFIQTLVIKLKSFNKVDIVVELNTYSINFKFKFNSKDTFNYNFISKSFISLTNTN